MLTQRKKLPFYKQRTVVSGTKLLQNRHFLLRMRSRRTLLQSKCHQSEEEEEGVKEMKERKTTTEKPFNENDGYEFNVIRV